MQILPWLIRLLHSLDDQGKCINERLVETRGDDRDKSDYERKLKLGKEWEKQTGREFSYYRVFENLISRSIPGYFSDVIKAAGPLPGGLPPRLPSTRNHGCAAMTSTET